MDRFVALAARLDAEELVLIGGPADRPLLDTLRANVQRVAEVDTAALDVVGLVEVLDTLDLLVSVDTGPAHLAAALGVPTVVIFGPTSKVRWGPIGEPHRVASLDLDCAPCSNTGGPRCPIPARAHECLEALTVEHVLAEIEAVER